MTASPPPQTPQLHIFEIPHIQDDICAYLTRDNLAHCTQVSRLWSALFTPYLYKTIELTQIRTMAYFFKDDAASVCALFRYKDSVQTLKASNINRLMLALLHEVAINSSVIGTSVDDVAWSSSAVLSVPLLPKSMRETLNLWNFTNLHTFEWIASKDTQSSANYTCVTATNSNPNNNDGCMTALQFIGLHIDRLETVSLKFQTLTRQHVRSLKNLLRGRRPRLRKLVVEYVQVNVQQSVIKRLVWTALSLYENNGNGDNSRSNEQAALETFHFVWMENGNRGWGPDSDSESEDDNDHHHHLSSSSSSRPHRPRQSHVKDLSFSFDKDELNPVPIEPLLQRCPEIESLSLGAIGRNSVLYELPDILREFCPQLRDLGVGNILAADTDFSQLIAGCSRTTNNFDGVDTSATTATKTAVVKVTGLQEFRILSRIEAFDEISTLTLARYHGASLETLDFSQQTRFPVHLFLQLIRHCPRLRVLRCNIELRKEYQGQTIDYSPLLSTQGNNASTNNSGGINNDWPFASTLKYLDLTAYRGSDMEMDSNYRHGDGSVSDLYIAYLYRQVARMTLLEEWRLGGWMMPLWIGWGLDKLSNLKSLKVLDLREHTFIRLSKVEVEWIARNWTALLEIWGLRSPNLQHSVQQLKALRPMIQFL